MKLCVALDLPSFEQNMELAKELKGLDIWLKVGFRSFIRDGRKIVDEIKMVDDNFKIFLDLKLYDIPNTMADAAYEIALMGVDMFNIHASCGKRAMREVMGRLESLKKRPIVLAVTALTSFENGEFAKIYGMEIGQKALFFANESYEAGLDGVVCSAHESLLIKNGTSKDFLTLTPAIRPFLEGADDQKRVADLEFAYENLVDFPVVGRPIYQALSPKETTLKILQKIKELEE